jgi:23S rRNA pseudouridine2605 synthase
MIADGRVSVNGEKISKPGTLVEETADTIAVDGVEVHPVEEKIYVLLNKPPSVMTTLVDPFKRKTVVDCLKKLKQRVYPVGRLDFDTEGVLLLCNDGDLTFRLAHPRYQVTRVYEATVTGKFTGDASQAIERGITLDDGAIGRAKVSILGFGKGKSRLRLVLTEGRKREVKQLCKKVGHPVERLRRTEFAGINCKDLKVGQWRHLTSGEVDRLKAMTGLIENSH